MLDEEEQPPGPGWAASRQASAANEAEKYDNEDTSSMEVLVVQW